MKTIVLVSPGHLGTNPRLVKEADALWEAGYDVHVISCDYFPKVRPWDEEIRSAAKWRWTCVSWKPSATLYSLRRLQQMSMRVAFARGLRSVFVTSLAHHLIVPALIRNTCQIPADLYIGHCLAALPAVVAAGRKRGAKIGFDAEDFHSGEASNNGRGQIDNAIARTLESKLLPLCHHLTTSSPLMAEAYQLHYNVSPVTILNVFPLDEAVEQKPAPETPSFYWFSQTIGAGRGLEQWIEILRQLDTPIRLDLRGHITEAYMGQLQERAKNSLIRLRFLAPDVPKTMVYNASGYTAGLGLETGFSLNNEIALSNKVYTYLLAGVPVILSRTRAQEWLAGQLGAACLLIDLNNVDDSAHTLSNWLKNPVTQSEARKKAFELGRNRFNWDTEKIQLITAIDLLFQENSTQR
jgi:glycosyltransferase involved in cell wall biosynthesis